MKAAVRLVQVVFGLQALPSVTQPALRLARRRQVAEEARKKTVKKSSNIFRSWLLVRRSLYARPESEGQKRGRLIQREAAYVQAELARLWLGYWAGEVPPSAPQNVAMDVAGIQNALEIVYFQNCYLYGNLYYYYYCCFFSLPGLLE